MSASEFFTESNWLLFGGVCLGFGFLIGVLIAAPLGRAAFGVLRPIFALFRLIAWPVRALARRLGLLPKTSAATRPVRNAVVGAASVVERGPKHETEIEWALRQPDEPTEGETAPDQPLKSYDFKEEEGLLQRLHAGFRSIRIPGAYLPKSLTDPLTEEIAQRFLGSAQKFFNRQVSLHANERALYEDVEGAVNVTLFRNDDRRCYYALNEMRKTINGNALTVVVVLFLAIAAFCAGVWTLFEPALDLAPELRTICVLVVFLLAGLFMFMIQHFGYAQQQRNNTRELISFLARYLSRISDRYREATAMARGVTVGDETDSQKLSQDARKWHKIMMWMPFRAYFIEAFVRNVIFQIHRNCGYYKFAAWSLVLAALAPIMIAFVFADPFHHFDDGMATRALLAALVGMLGVWYVILVEKVVLRDELNQIEWLGFDNLNVSRQMDDVVGKYAEDVGFWKGRLDR